VKLEFHEQFAFDVSKDADYYDGVELGLGNDFAREVWEAVQWIKRNPSLSMTIYRDVRRVRLKRFKEHSVRYRFIEASNTIRILGVFHAKRHPTRGRARQ